MRLGLALSLVLLFISASSAAAERPSRLLSEDASARECRMDPNTLTPLCLTVQVLRSRLSDGLEQTTLFFSATENGVEIPVFPTSFFPIDSQHFVMDRYGTRAILSFRLPPAEGQLEESQPDITVIWNSTDDFSSRKFSTEVIKEKTEEGVTKSRIIEREQELSANAEGMVGPLPVPNADGTPRFLTFNTATPAEGDDFASALLIIGKTITRTRLLEEEPDSFDFAE